MPRTGSIAVVQLQQAASDAVRVIAQAASDATAKLTTAADAATSRLSTAAETAAKVVSAAAAEQVRVVDNKNAGDHDLLVVLNTKMEDLKAAVKEFAASHDNYVLKDDFVFWRNLLVGGMISTIFIGIIVNLLIHANAPLMVHP